MYVMWHSKYHAKKTNLKYLLVMKSNNSIKNGSVLKTSLKGSIKNAKTSAYMKILIVILDNI